MLIWFHLYAFSVILPLLQSSTDFQVKQDLNLKCKVQIGKKPKTKQQTTALKKEYKGGTGLGWTTFSTKCLCYKSCFSPNLNISTVKSLKVKIFFL